MHSDKDRGHTRNPHRNCASALSVPGAKSGMWEIPAPRGERNDSAGVRIRFWRIGPRKPRPPSNRVGDAILARRNSPAADAMSSVHANCHLA